MRARAILQHDLWGLFDWLANPYAPAAQEEHRRKLRIRVARIIESLALTNAQIASLPDTYALTIASHRYSSCYYASKPEQTFLPDDLFKSDGPWVQIVASEGRRIGRNHEEGFGGRSIFQVFLRFPAAGPSCAKYIQQQNAWLKYHADQIFEVEGVMKAQHQPERPPFPVPTLPDGAQLVFVRRMMLPTGDEHVVATPVVESVRTIVYDQRELDPAGFPLRRFQAFDLDRRAFLQHQSSPIRAIDKSHRSFDFGPVPHRDAYPFSAMFETPDMQPDYVPPLKTLATCTSCHQTPHLLALGNTGFSIMTDRGRPRNMAAEIVPSDSLPVTAQWKEGRYEFAMLKGLLEASRH